MKPVTRVIPPSLIDHREQPIDPWSQMFEEHRQLALESDDNGARAEQFLRYGLIAFAVVLIVGAVGVVVL